MKTSRIIQTILSQILILLACRQELQAQGTVYFANSSATAVTNPLTHARVVAGTTFKVALYAAPDGTTDESQYVPAAVIGFPGPGIFSYGTCTALNIVPAGGFGMFQVRVWETAFGATYEAAFAAPPMNGRTALVGKSTILRIDTGDPARIPPDVAPSLTSSGLKSFVLSSAPVPSFYVDDIVVSEGTNGTQNATFTIRVYPPTPDVVSVDYATADGTATAGSDYAATTGTLVFAANETSKSVTIVITPDASPEADETFTLNLSNPVGIPLVRGQGTCLITEVQIKGISIDAAVTFNTVANHHYVVEKTDDLVTWTTVTGADNIAGTGANVSVSDKGAGCQSQRTYRARLLD